MFRNVGLGTARLGLQSGPITLLAGCSWASDSRLLLYFVQNRFVISLFAQNVSICPLATPDFNPLLCSVWHRAGV